MFIVYSITNISGRLTIRDTDFMTADKNYIVVENEKVSVEKFLEYENLDSVNYILPGRNFDKLRCYI